LLTRLKTAFVARVKSLAVQMVKVRAASVARVMHVKISVGPGLADTVGL